MGNENKSKNSGAFGRLAKENAEKNNEFGKIGDPSKKNPNIVHEEKPPSNKVGIDRGRWSD